jgi:predicted CoA-substrate-specific enzyme activase
MICAGIDAGSRAIKIALIDDTTHATIGQGVVDQGVHQKDLAADLLDHVLKQAGATRADIRRTVATGYGRNAVALADTTITEITCHARGVHHQHPDTRTIVDIGGQDSKLLHLTESGSVRDFAMNDRCAAGTGRFLEVVAQKLEVDLENIGALAALADKPASISSMCVVFAETEIIGLLASGESPENIVAGVQSSIATRTAAMSGGQTTAPVIFTGGVALIPGMSDAMATALDCPVSIARNPQLTGALGAALLAAKQKS